MFPWEDDRRHLTSLVTHGRATCLIRQGRVGQGVLHFFRVLTKCAFRSHYRGTVAGVHRNAHIYKGHRILRPFPSNVAYFFVGLTTNEFRQVFADLARSNAGFVAHPLRAIPMLTFRRRVSFFHGNGRVSPIKMFGSVVLIISRPVKRTRPIASYHGPKTLSRVLTLRGLPFPVVVLRNRAGRDLAFFFATFSSLYEQSDTIAAC